MKAPRFAIEITEPLSGEKRAAFSHAEYYLRLAELRKAHGTAVKLEIRPLPDEPEEVIGQKGAA